MRNQPTVVIQLVIKDEEEARERYGKKKIDPVTGMEFNSAIQLIDVDIKDRL
jgi:hypothetical protein